jgi:D-methionine transport system ATP-binding protein
MNVIKEVCDRVAVIDNSRIVEVGDVLGVFSNPQTPTSHSFVNVVISKEVPGELLHCSLEPGGDISSKLIKVSFIGSSAGKPLISSMIRLYKIDVNIIYGNIDRIKDTPFGNLTLELIGNPGLLQEALDYLGSQGLEIEVLKNA